MIPDALGFECLTNSSVTQLINKLPVDSNYITTSFITNTRDTTPLISLAAPDGVTYTAFSSSLASITTLSDLVLQQDTSGIFEGAFKQSSNVYTTVQASTSR